MTTANLIDRHIKAAEMLTYLSRHEANRDLKREWIKRNNTGYPTLKKTIWNQLLEKNKKIEAIKLKYIKFITK